MKLCDYKKEQVTGIKCKSESEIERWRQDKILQPITIEPVANFLADESHMVEYKEIMQRGIKLTDQVISDVGYRFRYNVFNRTNNRNFWQSAETES